MGIDHSNPYIHSTTVLCDTFVDTLMYIACLCPNLVSVHFHAIPIIINKKFRKFERKYRACIKRNGDKIETQTCYDIST